MGNECKIAILDNSNGDLCTSYPSKIIIPSELVENKEEEKTITVKFYYDPFRVEIKEKVKEKRQSLNIDPNIDLIDEKTLRSVSFVQLVNECKFCRVHGRFPVPVIFYGNKYVARSGTISRGAESVLRNIGTSVKNFLFSESKQQNPSIGTNMLHQRYIRQWDAELLRRLKCKHIIDLMVENKKVKYGVTVCTSEKAEKVGIYNNMDIQIFPYPGRESFVFKGKSEKKQYQFRWSDSGTCDSEFNSTLDLGKIFPDMDVKNYRDWDLVQITQNYLLMILHILGQGKDDEGLLIHCVSGWDRTPLFISLLRISLWADGEIHQSLDIDQMLYLTIAYDWMLFNHDLQERLKQYEEVLRFCFDFLQFITSRDFSILKFKKNVEKDTFIFIQKIRAFKLTELRDRFFVFYKKIVE